MPTCAIRRYVGDQVFPCILEPDHYGTHMSPGDSGDSLASKGERGPFLITWPPSPGERRHV